MGPRGRQWAGEGVGITRVESLRKGILGKALWGGAPCQLIHITWVPVSSALNKYSMHEEINTSSRGRRKRSRQVLQPGYRYLYHRLALCYHGVRVNALLLFAQPELEQSKSGPQLRGLLLGRPLAQGGLYSKLPRASGDARAYPISSGARVSRLIQGKRWAQAG